MLAGQYEHMKEVSRRINLTLAQIAAVSMHEYQCQHCGLPFNPHATRYLCPYCHVKNTCCE